MTSPLDAHLVVRRDGFDLDVEVAAQPGRVLAVLGPNGSGKTTALRALAGFVALAEGHVRLGSRVLEKAPGGPRVEPERRHIGFVHQDHLLFPHLTVIDNVAFGARCGGGSKAEARRRARHELDLVGLADRADERPGRLSGGQHQRVALARALAVDPELLLLDEPLSALDVSIRADIRRDLRARLVEFAGPTIIVTHDPLDALVLADDIVIIEGGRVTQRGPLAEVASRPATRYVADLVGTNLLAGVGSGTTVTIDGSDAVVALAEPVSGPVHLTISPSAITLHRHRPEGSARNVWPVTVDTVEMWGDRVRVRTAGPVTLVAEITPVALSEMRLEPGAPVWVAVKATEVSAYRA